MSRKSYFQPKRIINLILTPLLISSTYLLTVPLITHANSQVSINASSGHSNAASVNNSNNRQSNNQQGENTKNTNSKLQSNSTVSTQLPPSVSTAQQKHQAAMLKVCNNKQADIQKIMNNIDLRTNNQMNLFSSIATRVENFYLSSGHTISNYQTLVLAVNNAKIKTSTDLSLLNNHKTFVCSDSAPKTLVNSFQSYLKSEIKDLQNYRLAIKNLIVAVAQANKVSISSSTAVKGGN